MWGLLVQKEEQDAQKEKEAAERRKREEAQKAEVEKRRLQVVLRWPATLLCSMGPWLEMVPGLELVPHNSGSQQDATSSACAQPLHMKSPGWRLHIASHRVTYTRASLCLLTFTR